MPTGAVVSPGLATVPDMTTAAPARRARAAAVHVCIDCLALPEKPPSYPRAFVKVGDGPEYRPTTPRPTTGGPRSQRCATHARAHKRAQRARARATHKSATFGLTPEVQAALWAFQGGACPCGAKRAPELPPGVATDHDHDLAALHDHPDDRGCPDCVLGFLCAACNTDVVGRFSGRRGGRADVARILRDLADFLDDPPLARLLAQRPDLLDTPDPTGVAA